MKTRRWIAACYSTNAPGVDETGSYASFIQVFEDQVVLLINHERVEEGIPALVVSNPLAEATHAHSADMACHDYLSHYSIDGFKPSERATRP